MYHDFKGIANRATMWHISGMPFTGMPFTLKPQEDAPWRGLDYESLAITKQYSLPPQILAWHRISQPDYSAQPPLQLGMATQLSLLNGI